MFQLGCRVLSNRYYLLDKGVFFGGEGFFEFAGASFIVGAGVHDDGAAAELMHGDALSMAWL